MPYEQVRSQSYSAIKQAILRKYSSASRNATIAGDNDPNDRFGSRTTFGDFNGDGLDDLVITAPQKDVNGIEDVG